MITTSSLRESIILIIFGVVLVPIAAKRAQDAPGYWQTYSSTSFASNELSTSSFDSKTTGLATTPHLEWTLAFDNATAGVSRPQQLLAIDTVCRTWLQLCHQKPSSIADFASQQNDSTISSHATRTATRVEAGTPSLMTIRFSALTERKGQQQHATASHNRSRSTPECASELVAAEATTAPRIGPKIGIAATPSPPSGEVPARVSQASSRERWTLMLMGGAIVAVAMFMASC